MSFDRVELPGDHRTAITIDRWIRLAPQEAETTARRVFGFKETGTLQEGHVK